MSLQKPAIGFIGLGIMGKPMSLNLLKAGYSLTVHSRTKQKAAEVMEAGAKWADTPAQTAAASDIVFACVTDTPDVQDVLLGENGVIKSAKEGLICIDTSTISPDATIEMAKILAEKKVHLLDAPLTGGQNGAIEAKLSIMVGGDRAVFDKVLPILEVLGRKITYCGPSGSGQLTKLANQIMVVHTLMSMAEGLAFAEKAGLGLQTTYDVTTAGAAASNSLKVLGAKAITGDFKPGFMVDLALKDLRLVMEYSKKIGQPLPGTALAQVLLERLSLEGRGKDGTQAVIEIIRHLRK